MFESLDALWLLGREAITSEGRDWKGVVLLGKDFTEVSSSRELGAAVAAFEPGASTILLARSSAAIRLEDVDGDLSAFRRIVDLQLLVKTCSLLTGKRRRRLRTPDAVLATYLRAASEGSLSRQAAIGVLHGSSEALRSVPGDVHLILRTAVTRLIRKLHRTGELKRFFRYELPAQKALVHQSQNRIHIDLASVRAALEETDAACKQVRVDCLRRHALDPHGSLSRERDRVRILRPLIGKKASRRAGPREALELLRAAPALDGLAASVLHYEELRGALQALSGVGYLDTASVRPVYEAIGTATSRITMKWPGLQWMKKEHRRFVLPGDGHVMRYLDFRCFEPTILAVAARDEILMDACTNDLYSTVADWLALDGINDREYTKLFLLCLLYGRSRRRLVGDLAAHARIDEKEADVRYAAFEERLARSLEFKVELEKEAARTRRVHTAVGNWRLIGPKQDYLALNHYLQGTGALIFKHALATLFSYESDLRLVAPMHDGFVCAIPDDRADEAAQTAAKTMSDSFAAVLGGGSIGVTVENYF